MKREEAERFINHLVRLKETDRGALAALRHSLAFDPGDDPRAYPFVERWVGLDCHPCASRRLALYAVAGLFAAHPVTHTQSLAGALGQMLRDTERPSLELRFRALLEADADGLMAHLRQAVSLVAAEGLGYDHAALLCDLSTLLDDRAEPDWRDDVRRRWARQFYGTLHSSAERDAPAEAAVPHP